MRSHIEFRSEVLLEGTEPSGEKVARLLADGLPGCGFTVQRVVGEDWGWRVVVENAPFPLWIGCGHYLEDPDGHLCFIEPSRSFVRRWLKRVSTEATVERLADAIESILTIYETVSGLRWWSSNEVDLARR